MRSLISLAFVVPVAVVWTAAKGVRRNGRGVLGSSCVLNPGRAASALVANSSSGTSSASGSRAATRVTATKWSGERIRAALTPRCSLRLTCQPGGTPSA